MTGEAALKVPSRRGTVWISCWESILCHSFQMLFRMNFRSQFSIGCLIIVNWMLEHETSIQVATDSFLDYSAIKQGETAGDDFSHMHGRNSYHIKHRQNPWDICCLALFTINGRDLLRCSSYIYRPSFQIRLQR